MKDRLAGFPALDLDAAPVDLSAATGPDAIRELHAHLCAAGRVRDPGLLLRDLLARHALGASCLDPEVALPHARSAAVDDLILAVGRSAGGIRFDEEHTAIRLIILVAAPASAVDDYLRCTVQLARRLRQPAFRRGLLQAQSLMDFRASWFAAVELRA